MPRKSGSSSGRSRRRKGTRPVEQYQHRDKRRPNNPPAGLVDCQNRARTGGDQDLEPRPASGPRVAMDRQAGERQFRGADGQPARARAHRSPHHHSQRQSGTGQRSPARHVQRAATAAGSRGVLSAPGRLEQSPDRRRQPAGDEFAAAEGGTGRQAADGVRRPALRY